MKKLSDAKSIFPLLKAKMAVQKNLDSHYDKFYQEILNMMEEQTLFIDDVQLEIAKADSIDAAKAPVVLLFLEGGLQ